MDAGFVGIGNRLVENAYAVIAFFGPGPQGGLQNELRARGVLTKQNGGERESERRNADVKMEDFRTAHFRAT